MVGQSATARPRESAFPPGERRFLWQGATMAPGSFQPIRYPGPEGSPSPSCVRSRSVVQQTQGSGAPDFFTVMGS